MEEKKLTDEKVNATVKSLKWICNQIPQDLGDSNEEKMLKCIRLYCEIGIAVINQQKAEIERLTERENELVEDKAHWINKWKEQVECTEKLQKQVADLKEERENMQSAIFGLEEDKRQLQKQVDELKIKTCPNTDYCGGRIQQAVKDTAKEILAKAPTETNADEMFIHWLRERYGVEVE